MASPSPPATRRGRARETRRQTREQIVAAATELIRQQPYGELGVDQVMREAGIGRTIFYRHFDDLGSLLVQASREAIERLYEAQRTIAEAEPGDASEAVRRALEAGVEVYRVHGPLLRAVREAAAVDEQVAQGYAEMLRRFDDLAEQALRRFASDADLADVAETARALNRMNESYLVDTFGREAKVEPKAAVDALTEVWEAVLRRS
ncbi:MAG TPA: TetR/AcrR family transcriptional regulator [Thermoleophilaceae bacterium]|jgi:AcrR family transcriptional regulator